MSDTKVFALDDTEVAKIDAQQAEIKNKSRVAAQKGLEFMETISLGVKAVFDANEAQEELLRLYTRVAKSRARQYADMMDVDLAGKTVTFRKTEKDIARESRETEDEEEVEDDAEDEPAADPET